jgi:hypothetical protein
MNLCSGGGKQATRVFAPSEFGQRGLCPDCAEDNLVGETGVMDQHYRAADVRSYKRG